ncbi:MAG: hypothetical protein M1833_002865 [Piccolia ochrophora]|nr:MAG: hypothetical protein M1833_002865 [Piccolia ochrophora]
MAFTFGPKLICFYCGGKSNRLKDGSVRQWKCTQCDAVNHLDENGDITDPPAEIVTPAAQYGRPIPRSVSPPSFSTDKSLFCSTCIKNQHFLTESLASYLPQPTHPNYAQFVASYPAHRENLEKRYPQVCADCWPRVQERIKAAGYVAKTDHLRRMMERTRSPQGLRQRRGPTWGGREYVVFVGGLCWFASLAGQVAWNLFGALAQHESDGLREDSSSESVISCLEQLILERRTPSTCASQTSVLAGWTLVLALVSIWWNNKLMLKVRGSGGRMVHLNDFYKLQVMVMIAKSLAWWTLRDSSKFGLDPAAEKGVHIFMLMFTSLTSLLSLRTIKLDHTPRIQWHDGPLQPPIIGPSRGASSSPPNPNRPQPSHQNTLTPAKRPFPLHRLIESAAPDQTPQSYDRPLTPPAEDDLDAMDWTPTQQAFNPKSIHMPQSAPEVIPPPAFSTYQRLPAPPRSQAARLRNPPNTVPFFKVEEDTQQALFNAITKGSSPNDGGHAPGQPDAEQSPHQYAEIAPARFFPQADYDANTGLESIFDKAFSLNDEPAEVKAARAQQAQAHYNNHYRRDITKLFYSLLLAGLLSGWKLANPTRATPLRLLSLLVTANIALRRLVASTSAHTPRGNPIDIAILLVEVLTSLALAAALLLGKATPELIDFSGTALLGGMAAQEAWLFATSPTPLATLEKGNASHPTRHHLAPDTPPRRGRPTHEPSPPITRAALMPSTPLSALSLGPSAPSSASTAFSYGFERGDSSDRTGRRRW